MAVGLEFDPTSEDSSNVALNIADGTKFRLISTAFPTPDRDVNWASSADTEGALPANLRYQNRTITIEVRVYGSSYSNMLEEIGKVEQKIGRVNAEGATLKYTTGSGTSCVFDLLEGVCDWDLDNRALATFRAVLTITLTAKPFWRSGTEVEGSLHEETTLPFVIGVDESITGDVPALGRLLITEKQAQDQWTLIWGTQSRNYSNSENAELFYQAESRTPLGGEKKAGPSGASGAGENTIFCGSLIPSYQAVMSTQKASAGAHLSHVGTYRVFARIQRPTTNTGAVSLRLSWAQGDFLRYTANDAKTYAVDELEGVWTLVDLGLVRISKVTAGTQRWEGRIEAKSTVNGDDIYVDCLAFFPVDEGYGSLKIEPNSATPSTVSAHDEFDQAEGALTGKTLPLGGKWEGNGSATDFTVTSGHVAQRTATSDGLSILTGPRIVRASTPTLSAVSVQVDMKFSAVTTDGSLGLGVFARRVDAENLIGLEMIPKKEGSKVVLQRAIAGTVTTIWTSEAIAGAATETWYTLALTIDVNGNWSAYGSPQGYPLALLKSGNDSNLATGGTLASGQAGFFDHNWNTTASTRRYDNFILYATPADAAVFANRKAEVRWDRMQREDSAGELWVPRPDYQGSYFKPQPARREGRKVRTIVKLSRGNIDSMQDVAIDDAAFRLYWQPRGLVHPES